MARMRRGKWAMVIGGAGKAGLVEKRGGVCRRACPPAGWCVLAGLPVGGVAGRMGKNWGLGRLGLLYNTPNGSDS